MQPPPRCMAASIDLVMCSNVKQEYRLFRLVFFAYEIEYDTQIISNAAGP